MKAIGKKNVYTCKGCRHRTITVDLDKGTTPFMIECPKCEKAWATSSSYQLPIGMPLVATHEWYMPGEAEKATLPAEVLEGHVDRGGLLLREIGEETDPTKKSKVVAADDLLVSGELEVDETTFVDVDQLQREYEIAEEEDMPDRLHKYDAWLEALERQKPKGEEEEDVE